MHVLVSLTCIIALGVLIIFGISIESVRYQQREVGVKLDALRLAVESNEGACLSLRSLLDRALEEERAKVDTGTPR